MGKMDSYVFFKYFAIRLIRVIWQYAIDMATYS